MIFHTDVAKLIRQGKKSQTRQIKVTSTCPYRTGKSYAVQPSRGKAICRVTVMDVREERLGDISLKDVKREGFVTSQEFFESWRSTHGTLDRDANVWVVTFTLGDTTDTPRYLRPLSGTLTPPNSEYDYAAESYQGMRDEPEAVSDAELEIYSKIAQAKDAQRMNEPLRKQRDQIARLVADMLEELPSRPSPIRDSIRRLERELQVLNRKLAA